MTRYVILFLIISTPLFIFSQSDTIKRKKLILASISYEMGPMLDRYPQIDLETMYDLTKTPSQLDRNLIDHDVTYDRNAEGSNIGLSIALIPFSKKENDYSTKGEIRLGLFYSVRGTILSYVLRTESGAFKSVSYSTRFKELSLHGSYVWKYNPEFAKRFTLYGGLGIGLGSTFNDQTSVAEHFSSGQTNEIPFSIFNKYDGKSSLFARGFVPAGISFALSERFDVGLEGSFGVGLQQVYSGESYFIPTSGYGGIKLGYYF